MKNKFIEYCGKNYLIDKFTAYENITFSYRESWNNYLCSFSCKLDFSGTELIIEKYFLVKPFLDEYEDRKWFGFLPVSFRKKNPVYEFLSSSHPKCIFLKEHENDEATKLLNGFCSEYINWVAEKLNAKEDLNEVIKMFNQIYNLIKESKWKKN